ncbi:hypothetical protein BKA62DRAFT_721417 [Auriculariales sp. MPI-PUGE-AT-0066]|nr:hypothetical protein BKA62DRAFT_721417 [Auriculariales sp. MPI-PUGE-AT-0066]
MHQRARTAILSLIATPLLLNRTASRDSLPFAQICKDARIRTGMLCDERNHGLSISSLSLSSQGRACAHAQCLVEGQRLAGRGDDRPGVLAKYSSSSQE